VQADRGLRRDCGLCRKALCGAPYDVVDAGTQAFSEWTVVSPTAANATKLSSR
jgi:hypothetical protein